MSSTSEWPALPREAWAATCDTMHMYAQIIGKVRLALTPIEPEWENVPLHVTARGLSTGLLFYGDRAFEIELDVIAHTLDIQVSNGKAVSMSLLSPRSVADFFEEFTSSLHALGIDVRMWPVPVEVANPIPFIEDRVHASYDPEYARRFWEILLRVQSVFAEHHAAFRGRHTKPAFFWGTFDLAYVRFSGRPAEPPPNANRILRTAMDAEQIAAGFWPGDERFPEPAFFAYGYPRMPGIERASIQPAAAFWSDAVGEFLLRYEDVRKAPSPRAAIRQFLESTYEACARLGEWDRVMYDGAAIPAL